MTLLVQMVWFEVDERLNDQRPNMARFVPIDSRRLVGDWAHMPQTCTSEFMDLVWKQLHLHIWQILEFQKRHGMKNPRMLHSSGN